MTAEEQMNLFWWRCIVWPVRAVCWIARCACFVLHALSGWIVYRCDTIEFWADRTFIDVTRKD